jgi:hypothetical protein
MKRLNTALAILLFQYAFAQDSIKSNGWFFGAAAGISSVHLSANGLTDESQISLSFPNMKIGKMLTEKSAILLYLPGSIYRYKGSGRERDRGFEGIVPAYQYWMTEKWWILGGVGLTLDAPAFYDIQDPSERKFYFGPSVLGATGFEIWQKNRFSLDLQARIHYGYATIPEGKRTGLATNLLIGFNWYFQRHDN